MQVFVNDGIFMHVSQKMNDALFVLIQEMWPLCIQFIVLLQGNNASNAFY
jgi:hypothetical protein